MQNAQLGSSAVQLFTQSDRANLARSLTNSGIAWQEASPVQRVVPKLECIARLLTNCSSSCTVLAARKAATVPSATMVCQCPLRKVWPPIGPALLTSSSRQRTELMLPRCLACLGHTVLACWRLAGRRRLDSHPSVTESDIKRCKNALCRV